MERHRASVYPSGSAVPLQYRVAGLRRAPRPRRRRGVASVLAMMFLVIFGSLAAAMAVVAQGNLRTADSSLKVSRAMSAAETGLVFAANRMAEESRRFVVEKGIIDPDFAEQLWIGTIDPGDVVVLPPNGYPDPPVPPRGIIEGIRDAHLADDHDIIVETGDVDLPEIDEVYGRLFVRPIALSDAPNAPYFRLRYELLDSEPTVRVTSEGVDGNITRVIQMDFSIDKKIEYAILSTNRIMIGKNVLVEGPLGSRYGVVSEELDTENGDPLVMRSDFYFLDPALDAKLDTFFNQVVLDDVDGDCRLRPDHPVEGGALGGLPVLADYDGDEFVDDFDLFLAHFDADADGRICYNSTWASEVGIGGLSDEFDSGGEMVDRQLARLIDEAVPDRDGDGDVTDSDRAIGYRDGILDVHDIYAKVDGRLAFAVARADWEAEHGESYQTIVEGPLRPAADLAPVTFEVDQTELLEITTAMFDDSQSWFEAQVPGPAVRAPGDPPVDPALLALEAIESGTFIPASDPGAEWESVPFGSAGSYDHYKRPVYRDMTFRNVRIPMGNNGLFERCTFVGVTWVESEPRCSHQDWNYAGALQPVDDGGGGTIYELRFPDLPPPPPDHIDIDGFEVRDTREYSNNLRFEGCTFLGSIAGDKLDEYTHWRNKIQVTGETRWFIDPDEVDPLLTDSAGVTLKSYLGAMTESDRQELEKSSIGRSTSATSRTMSAVIPRIRPASTSRASSSPACSTSAARPTSRARSS
jgi:hypothetical protein